MSLKISMELAERIFQRGISNLNFGYGMGAIARSLNATSSNKVNKRVKEVEAILRESDLFWFKIPQENRKEHLFGLWYPLPTNNFHLAEICVSRKGLDVRNTVYAITEHAMIRVMYRSEARTLHAAINEIFSSYELLRITGYSITKTGDESTFPTKNGMSVMRRNEDGSKRIVTWVDKQKLGQNQIEKNNSEFSLLMSFAKRINKPPRETLLENLDLISDYESDFKSQGGDLNDKEALVDYAWKQMIAKRNAGELLHAY